MKHSAMFAEKLPFSPKKGKNHPVRALLLLTQPSVAVLAIMLLAMQWRIPTQVQIDLTFHSERIIENNGEILRQSASGDIPLDGLKYAEVRYPDFPKLRPAVFTSFDKIEIIPIATLNVQEVSQDTARQEWRIRLTGAVEFFRLVSQKRSHNLRASQFDALLRSRWALFGILGLWLAFTAIGWFNIYKELKNR